MAKSKEGRRAADEGLLVEEDFEQQPRESDLEMSEAIGPPEGLGEQRVIGFPYSSEEEVGMEMEPAVVGPPSYGSPDPDTSAGRLLPLRDHPLNSEHYQGDSAISDDYGADVRGAKSEFGTEGSHHGGPSLTDLEKAARGGAGAGEEGYAGMKVAELKELAKERGISGYSSLGKEDLIALHEEWDETPPEDREETFGSGGSDND